MKQICCIDCVHFWDIPKIMNDDIVIHYYCDAGSVMKEIEDPERVINCRDFKQFIEDI